MKGIVWREREGGGENEASKRIVNCDRSWTSGNNPGGGSLRGISLKRWNQPYRLKLGDSYKSNGLTLGIALEVAQTDTRDTRRKGRGTKEGRRV